MMDKSFRRALTPEDHGVLRNWTRGVLIVYGVLALTVFGLVSLHQRLANGSKDPAATEVTAAAAANRNHRNR